MMENVKRHPEHERRIYSRSEENGNTSAEVIDSSLCATIPFPILPTKHSCPRSEWRFWESTSPTMGNGKRHNDEERKASSWAWAKDLYPWWGKREDAIRVIDSSLCAILLPSLIPTKHSSVRSEWRFWESSSLTMGNGKCHNEGKY